MSGTGSGGWASLQSWARGCRARGEGFRRVYWHGAVFWASTIGSSSASLWSLASDGMQREFHAQEALLLKELQLITAHAEHRRFEAAGWWDARHHAKRSSRRLTSRA